MFEANEQNFDINAVETETLTIIAPTLIRKISMSMHRGIYYTGIAFYDVDEVLIYNGSGVWTLEDSSNDKWTPIEEIPEGQRIIGLKATTSGKFIANISFILGTIGNRDIAGEIQFPKLESFP